MTLAVHEAAPFTSFITSRTECLRTIEARGDTAMKRLTSAPNLALATLWADLLTHAGVPTSVQRQYASGIAGEVPPDQTLPELWVMEAEHLDRARTLLHELRNPPQRRWSCTGCGELVDGPFEQCWNCGAAMPA